MTTRSNKFDEKLEHMMYRNYQRNTNANDLEPSRRQDLSRAAAAMPALVSWTTCLERDP